ncbi:LLM class flavin-dependent oxidoreductase [Spirillospora sp. CA-108201]
MGSDRGEPRFGVWAPHHGYFGAENHPDAPPDAGYGHSRATALLAEEAGFESILIAQQTISTRLRDADVLEPWTAAAAIAEATERIEIIAAIKPLLYNPGLLAKMALGIDDISQGRFALNVVSGWFLPELERLGIPVLGHDERYAYSEEWLTIVRGLFSGERVSFEGRYLNVTDLTLRPRSVDPRGPAIYLGGESEPARRLAAEQADVFFINGRDVPATRTLVDDLAGRPRAGAPLRFALSAFVIARATAREAREEFAHLLDLSRQDDTSGLRKGTDPDTVMMRVNGELPTVGTNGGTNAGLVGSYDEVAERLGEFTEAGIELFMLQFQPLLPELRRFGDEVIPRVRAAATPGAAK